MKIIYKNYSTFSRYELEDGSETPSYTAEALKAGCAYRVVGELFHHSSPTEESPSNAKPVFPRRKKDVIFLVTDTLTEQNAHQILTEEEVSYIRYDPRPCHNYQDYVLVSDGEDLEMPRVF